jgi:hypothetical protein
VESHALRINMQIRWIGKEISVTGIKINVLAPKASSKGIGQETLDLGIERDGEFNGIGMGVLSDGTPYLNQRGLAALCGVQNAHIGTISAQWDDPQPKPRIASIRGKRQGIPMG